MTDYIKDGLLFCARCNTPKEVEVTLFGEKKKVRCLCRCGQAALERRREKERLEEEQRRIQRLRMMGFPDSELASSTFDNDDHSNERLTRIAKNYVENFDEMLKQGKGLLLFGSVGTGKTFISACIANALIDRGHPCMVTNFSRLTNTLQGMQEKQSYLDRLGRFHLLVIDDLASERDTEYMGEIVQSIIDARYRSKKPLIVTTNLTSDELKHPAEIRKQRIYSRLFEMCVPVEVKGKDRRKEKLKEEYKTMREVLEI